MAVNVRAAIRRATLSAQRDMDKLDAASLASLKQLYEQALADIEARIAAHVGGDGTLALQELQSLLAQVNARLDQLSRLRDQALNTGIDQAAGLGLRPFAAAVDGIPASLTATAAMRIHDEAVHFVRTFIAQDGLQLSDRIWRIDRHAREAVGGAIEQAIIQGHSAAQAAREFVARGEAVPFAVASKMNAAHAGTVAKTVAEAFTGAGSPMDNALRLFRTELNRAHGEAYIKGALDHPDAAGVRFKLSPAHPKPDICDLHAAANLHGLGPGVYPSREACPWPAHPNTLSYVEVVFRDEITAEDRAGKETPMQALDRLSPDQQRGVLGAHKHEVFKEGQLTQGMIKAPWSRVRARIERKTR